MAKEEFSEELKEKIFREIKIEKGFIHQDYKELVILSKMIDTWFPQLKIKGMYCAIPSRMRERDEEIKKYVHDYLKLGPFSPFDIMDFKYWEAGNGGRQAALYGTRTNLILYEQVGLFGISEGACGDAELALLCNKQVNLFYKEKNRLTAKLFDEEWFNYAMKIFDLSHKKEHLLPIHGGTGRFYNLYELIKSNIIKEENENRKKN